MGSLPLPLFGVGPSPVEPLDRLRAQLGSTARLLVKRDDVLPMGCGGNKVRKLAYVTAAAVAQGADTLITCGGVQSNHARATRRFARLEGLILDPTYTAKAAAGLLARLHTHPPDTDAPIVFWHTGGLPGVFA